MRASYIPILLDTMDSYKRKTERSSNKEARLCVRVVTWLGVNDVDLLNSDLTTLGENPTQGKSWMMNKMLG